MPESSSITSEQNCGSYLQESVATSDSIQGQKSAEGETSSSRVSSVAEELAAMYTHKEAFAAWIKDLAPQAFSEIDESTQESRIEKLHTIYKTGYAAQQGLRDRLAGTRTRIADSVIGLHDYIKTKAEEVADPNSLVGRVLTVLAVFRSELGTNVALSRREGEETTVDPWGAFSR